MIISPRFWKSIVIGCFCLLAVISGETADKSGLLDYSEYGLMPLPEKLTDYSRKESNDAVFKLGRRLERGEIRLKYDESYGYLLSVLEQLAIQVSSQILVFSKSSLQRKHISPKSPRAIYFNDKVFVGWIPGAPKIELASIDPQRGVVLYTLKQPKSSPLVKPQFSRNNKCLECHVTSRTLGVPGLVMRSFATDDKGQIDLLSGWATINHNTPLAVRWGGWYVSGDIGKQTHHGNIMAETLTDDGEFASGENEDRVDLKAALASQNYPAKTSNVVALMVYGHQLHMQNLITRLHYESLLDRPIKDLVTGFLKYLLFIDEIPLDDNIKGDPEFITDFQLRDPRDDRGRSLREFDLTSRIFKYPCSYMIYSDAFQSLPRKTKRSVYKRLWLILVNEDTDSAFQALAEDSKKAILEILADTAPDLPKYWAP